MVSGRARAKRWGSASWSFACAFALAWLSLWAFVERGHAQEAPELTLDWRADPGCPDRAWALARLGDRLGRSLAEHSASGLWVAARLSRTKAGFTLELSSRRATSGTGATRDVQGVRTLSDVRCEEIAQAAILMIALTLEDQRGEQAIPAKPPTGPASTSEGTTQAGPASTPPKPESPPSGARTSPNPPAPPAGGSIDQQNSLAMRAAALLDYGFLPGVGVGPELAVAFMRRRLRLELAGFWLPRQATEGGAGGRAAVTLWALRPLACGELWSTPRGGLEIAGCAGLELGRTRARGTDLTQPREPDWLYRAAWGSLRFGARLSSRWAVLVEPGIAIPLGRPRFVSETTNNSSRTELHTPAIVAGRLTLGLETRF